MSRLFLYGMLSAFASLTAETFQNPRHVVVDGGANNLGAADFNGDGLPDFYSLSSETNLYISPQLNIELATSGGAYSID